MIEFEKRGSLTKDQVIKLTSLMQEKGELLKNDSEKVVFFETKEFPTVGNFNTGTARLSLKCDNKGNHFRIKEGNPSANVRSEYSVELKDTDIYNLIYILNRLGLTDGFYRPTDRKDYKFGNLMVTIKTNCVMGDHFELELINPENNFEIESKTLIEEIKLEFWTTEEYKTRIAHLMGSNPAINLIESKIF